MNFKEEFDLSTLADVTEVNDSNSSIVKMFGYISLQVSESVSAIFSVFFFCCIAPFTPPQPQLLREGV